MLQKKKIKVHNPNLQQIPYHPCRISIVRGSGSRKTNALLNLINRNLYTDRICLYGKDPYEAKYQLLLIIFLN